MTNPNNIEKKKHHHHVTNPNNIEKKKHHHHVTNPNNIEKKKHHVTNPNNIEKRNILPSLLINWENFFKMIKTSDLSDLVTFKIDFIAIHWQWIATMALSSLFGHFLAGVKNLHVH